MVEEKMIGNKRGWVRIVEAFVAILLITGVFLVLLGEGQIKKDDSGDRIFSEQGYILEKIQANNSLRDDILEASTLPIGWTDSEFPPKVKELINSEKPVYLECEGRICEIDDNCLIGEKEQDVYVRDAIITGNLTFYSPRKIKLFCWEN